MRSLSSSTQMSRGYFGTPSASTPCFVRPYRPSSVLTYRAGAAEDYGDVVLYMREKAAQLGADGIIMIGSGAGPSVLAGQVIVTMTDFGAIVIVYKD